MCPQKVPTHRPAHLPTKQERDRYFKAIRGDTEQQAFYTSGRWRKLREVKLGKAPWCELCIAEGVYTEATHVHHVKPLKTHPDLALDIDNLESMCISHHSKVHGCGSRDECMEKR